MAIIDSLFDYLEAKIPEFSKSTQNKSPIFTCPNFKNHKTKDKVNETMIIMNGTDKMYCTSCGKSMNTFDIVRFVEPDKANLSDAQITEYLNQSLNLDLYTELDAYIKYGWSLFPLAKNTKIPPKGEKWRENEHRDKVEMIKWLQAGAGIAVNCELSHIIVVDVDTKGLQDIKPEELKNREELISLLEKADTLVQITPSSGKHYIFKEKKEVEQVVNMGGTKIDTRTSQGYIVVAPTRIYADCYTWKNLGVEIKELPEDIEKKLKELSGKAKKNEMTKEEVDVICDTPQQEHSDNPIELVNNNLSGCCNNTFIQLGGALKKIGIPLDKERAVLHYLNRNWLKNPMPSNAIEAMLSSLEDYTTSEDQQQQKIVYDCCALLKRDITAKEIVSHTELKPSIVNKYLSEFTKKGLLVRIKWGRYDFKEKIEWTNEKQTLAELYPYKIPYFDHVAYFRQGDIILIGSPTGKGKTTVAMNIVKQIRVQGIIPYYISLESGSRHDVTAKDLGLTHNDYYISKEPVENPIQIELEPNAFTILDWIDLGEDFAATQTIFGHLSRELRRKSGILVVFSQLKEDYSWFAVNLIKSFARFTARFVLDDTTGLISHFDIDKMTEPKGHYLTARVETEFKFDTKELRLKL